MECAIRFWCSTAPLESGFVVAVSGSIPQLGQWHSSQSLRMRRRDPDTVSDDERQASKRASLTPAHRLGAENAKTDDAMKQEEEEEDHFWEGQCQLLVPEDEICIDYKFIVVEFDGNPAKSKCCRVLWWETIQPPRGIHLTRQKHDSALSAQHMQVVKQDCGVTIIDLGEERNVTAVKLYENPVWNMDDAPLGSKLRLYRGKESDLSNPSSTTSSTAPASFSSAPGTAPSEEAAVLETFVGGTTTAFPLMKAIQKMRYMKFRLTDNHGDALNHIIPLFTVFHRPNQSRQRHFDCDEEDCDNFIQYTHLESAGRLRVPTNLSNNAAVFSPSCSPIISFSFDTCVFNSSTTPVSSLRASQAVMKSPPPGSPWELVNAESFPLATSAPWTTYSSHACSCRSVIKQDKGVVMCNLCALRNKGLQLTVRHGDLIGDAYILAEQLMCETRGNLTLPIYKKDADAAMPLPQRIVGAVSVHFLVCYPFRDPRNNLRYSWAERLVLNTLVGHRGLGITHGSTGKLTENTLDSFKAALRRGTEYVEFDVQLTRDRKPVVFHDQHVNISAHTRRLEEFVEGEEGDEDDKRERKAMSVFESPSLHAASSPLTAVAGSRSQSESRLFEHGMLDTPNTACNAEGHPSEQLKVFVYQLTRRQIKQLKLFATKKVPMLRTLIVKHWTRLVPGAAMSKANRILTTPIFGVVPSLREAFKCLPPHLGFNVEVKYPVAPIAEEFLDRNAQFEMNVFCDAILEVVMSEARSRKVVFSCFHPDICQMLAVKQKRYRVLFLTDGGLDLDYSDRRCTDLSRGVEFVLSTGISGLALNNQALRGKEHRVKEIKSKGLYLWTWGPENSDADWARRQKELGVDAVISDSIESGTVFPSTPAQATPVMHSPAPKSRVTSGSHHDVIEPEGTTPLVIKHVSYEDFTSILANVIK